ncbi:MAG TPA: YfiR family protein [Verrucomicrobiae bacterium]
MNCGLKRLRGALVFAGLLLANGPVLPAETSPAPEYQLKAAFLFNFAQFVEWPAQAFPEAQTPLIIGVLGENPFGTYLDDLVRGETVKNRPLVVQRFRRVDEIKTCHVLFIGRPDADRPGQALTSLKGRSILTVGDTDSFAQRGGMIRFASEKNKIRMKINLEAAKAAGLTISSKLLRSADIVAPGKD